MIHVFVGPTLPRADPVLASPCVQVWPPVRHGDLFHAAIVSGDTVVILDGVYHQSPALRHKEILAVLDRGVRVIGAASIGALRAAELAPFGMLGIGRIYDAFVSGELVGDDEVAVGHSPDGNQEALTWPLVNLRYAADQAVAAGLLAVERAAGLVDAWRAIDYPQRTTTAVRAVCHREDATVFTGWLTGQLAYDEHRFNLKRADARAAVRAAVDGSVSSCGRLAIPAQLQDTTYFRRWSNAFARSHVDGIDLSTQDRVLYQQVFDPAFPDVWATYLEHRSRHPVGGGPAVPLAERLARAGGDLPAHQVFHPVVDLRQDKTVSLLLAAETREDRRAVARYAAVLARERHLRPGFVSAAVSDDLTRQILMQVWPCSAGRFDAEAASRGLSSGASAVEEAKRFMPGFREDRGVLRRAKEEDIDAVVQ